ncbi:hypothetical protein ES703_62070 [subsurface metagenome]
MGKDRAPDQLELGVLLPPYPGAYNIGGEKVGSKLDAGILAADDFGKNLGEQGLTQTWVVLEKDVTVGQTGGQKLS